MKKKKGAFQIGMGIAIIAGLFFVLIIIGVPFLIEGEDNSFNKKIPMNVAELKEFTESDLNSYETYKKFAQEFNDLGTIINNQNIVQIPKLDVSELAHKKILKFIVEFGPLVDNYNQVISASKVYNKTRLKKDLELFYSEAGNFALELALINGAVFYSSSFKTVGTVYRASGLQVIAPKCKGCVSVILSTSHWTIRNGLVELMSQFSRVIEDKKDGWDEITIEYLKNNTSSFLEEAKTITGEFIQGTRDYNYTEAGKNIKKDLSESANKTKDWLRKISFP